MTRAPLLLEIGCEEIPARMIQRAADDFSQLVCEILDRADLGRGAATAWGGSRRLAVRIESVQERQADRVEQLLGPPANVAFDTDGRPTRAAVGFAKKQGISPDELRKVSTDKGDYSGFRREVGGQSVEQVLGAALGTAVAGMQFAKSMRWGSGKFRWVRPVHWLVALHGEAELRLEVLGTKSGNLSTGHRFLCVEPVRIEHPDGYLEALRRAYVLVSPDDRRLELKKVIETATQSIDAEVIPDDELLDEVSYLVEWPGIVCGSFDAAYLQLPREILVTTLRHHQKCFSAQTADGNLAPYFLAVANTDNDPAGHIRRGNEWVVGGRLEDARFFWQEDRKKPLALWAEGLDRVTLHAKIGSYSDKAKRCSKLTEAIGIRIGLDRMSIKVATDAATICKADLVTGTVGEFPELQGQVGGLLLRAEGVDERVCQAVYHHYRPAGPDDSIPPTAEAQAVALADKLDTVHQFVARVARPTGSRDPFGLRRATNGIFRILSEARLPVSLTDLSAWAEGNPEVDSFLRERFIAYLRDQGAASGEVAAVLRDGAQESRAWSIGEIRARLDALREVRGRDDFVRLVELTKRVDNILTKNDEDFSRWVAGLGGRTHPASDHEAQIELERHLSEHRNSIAQAAEHKQFDRVVEGIASFIRPVDRFFEQVLVLDPNNPDATAVRALLLQALRDVLTADFDIRELAGEAERKI